MCHCCVYSFVPVAWRGQKQFHHWELESFIQPLWLPWERACFSKRTSSCSSASSACALSQVTTSSGTFFWKSILWIALIYEGSDHGYLCKLTRLQQLFVLSSGVAGGIRSQSGDCLYVSPCSIHTSGILIMPFSLKLSLSLHGLVHFFGWKRAKNLQASCQKPFRVFVTLWHSFRSHCSSGFHSGFN